MPRLPPATTTRQPSKLKAIFCISLLRDACPDSCAKTIRAITYAFENSNSHCGVATL